MDKWDEMAAELCAEWRAGSDVDSRFIRIVAAELRRMAAEIERLWTSLNLRPAYHYGPKR